MALVRLDNVHKHYGAQVVLDGATCDIHPGEKVGLIGRNGGGKSTLLKVLIGTEEADDGQVINRRGVRVGYLPQIPEMEPGNSVRSETMRAFARVFDLESKLRAMETAMSAPADDATLGQLATEYGHVQEEFEAAGGYDVEHRVDAALMGLGFSEADFAKPVEALSGGEKNRLALVKVLLSRPDLLVLDEPTNYLDLPTTQWLEAFLKTAQPAVLVVSHDRYFLDKVTGRTLEVYKGRVRSWKGNYSRAMVLKEESAEADRRAYDNQLDYIAKEEEFIRRHIGSQRTKEAIGRRTRLKRLVRLPEPETKAPLVKIRFGDPGRSAYTACEARGLTKSYGERTLFKGVNLQLDRGARLGIVGPNGAGKTTLLSLLRGRIPPDAGEVRWGTGVDQAWFDQEHGDLKPHLSVLDNVRESRPDAGDQQLRTFLGALLFSGDDVFKDVSALSGGERARVSLAKLLLTPSNFMVLDEPTNHLDIRSRAAVEAALDNYDGTMIIVSHDRYLLDKLATQVLVLGPETPKVQLGNFTDYVEREARAKAKAAEKALQRKKQAKQAVHQQAVRAQKLRAVEKIEADIESTESRLAAINTAMADPANYADGETMRALQQDLDRTAAQLKRFEAEWEQHAR